MRYPPRLSHLATRAVVVAKLAPTYAEANSLEDEEAVSRLDRALQSPLLEDLLNACWTELQAGGQDEEALLKRVASSLKNRPQRPGKIAPVTAGWSAFLVLADVHAGTASDAAQRLLETEEGKKRANAGVAEVGKHLAAELSRK
jgi:hypothetical protein